MNGADAIKIILSELKEDDIALFTNGFISRYAFALRDRASSFYMIGSMGLVSSVGLGIAMNTSKKVFIFDGDGSILMDMGTLAQIADSDAGNIFHVVLDNESYESTGGQPTISRRVSLEKVAKAAGYRHTLRIDQPNDPKKIKKIMLKKGPVFILLKVRPVGKMNMGRISIVPHALTKRISKRLQGAQ